MGASKEIFMRLREAEANAYRKKYGKTERDRHEEEKAYEEVFSACLTNKNETKNPTNK